MSGPKRRQEGEACCGALMRSHSQTAPIGVLCQPTQGPEPTIRRSMCMMEKLYETRSSTDRRGSNHNVFNLNAATCQEPKELKTDKRRDPLSPVLVGTRWVSTGQKLHCAIFQSKFFFVGIQRIRVTGPFAYACTNKFCAESSVLSDRRSSKEGSCLPMIVTSRPGCRLRGRRNHRTDRRR